MRMSFRESAAILGISIIILLSVLFGAKAEPHLAILSSLIFVTVYAAFRGFGYETLEQHMINGIREAIKPILIMLLVGMTIAVWMMSGAVPTLLHFGLETLSATWFAPSALIITMIVSTFTGSSFTTIGTVGVALMGIAVALGVNPALAAGAIISGACFGDKMSPLSDTTNFAPGIVNVSVFDHIRFMMGTTVPAITITFILFFIFGRGNGSIDAETIGSTQQELARLFQLSPWTLLSPLLVMILALRKTPVVPTLIAGVLSGLLLTGITQGNWNIGQWMSVIQNGLKLETENQTVASIISKGGLQSMMWSVSLVMLALAFGGVLRGIGVIDVIIEKTVSKLKRDGSIISSAALASIGVNIMAGEQYLSILLPGQAFKKIFEDRSIDLRFLSRALEDGGTLVNPLIPWGVSGAFFASTLGVPVTAYVPFAFFLLLSPFFTFLLAFIRPTKKPAQDLVA
ncbi:Na+/H+ antiporter NhaC [Exiguobacterium undae]|uniref:Na+/H+ antiporter NhaC n=1 Tax=Exiguobacterium undae TaxID=169177 RepID=A0ABX2V6P3_9BACL|nr:Na+/H+ antiporter NhaC [Exiguobacterium undae]OAN12285.1 Na+/H+ antiporter NhaC [Exiguobacterium undae]